MTSTQESTPPAAASATLRDRLRATDRAIAAAHDTHVREAMSSVRWERRGLLRRLTRG